MVRAWLKYGLEPTTSSFGSAALCLRFWRRLTASVRLRGIHRYDCSREVAMSAYVMAFVDMHDHTRFAQVYVPSVASTLELFGGRVIAASEDPTTLEGSVPPGRTVLLEFPDLDSARTAAHLNTQSL